MAIIEIDKAYIIEAKKRLPLYNPNNLRIQRIDSSNMMDSVLFNTEDTLLKFKEFNKNGHLGYYCYLEDACILRTWIFTKSDVTFVGRNFIYELEPNEFFSGWSETKEDARGIGAFSFTLNSIIHELNDKRITAYVASDNIASLKGTKKIGFEIIRKFLLIKLSRLSIQIEYFRFNRRRFISVRFGHKIKSI
jgi:hypothetical protein